MEEVISQTLGFLGGVLAVLIVQFVKPEWFVHPLMNWIQAKLGKKKADTFSDVLAVKFIETGIDMAEALPDVDPEDKEFNEGVKLVREGIEKMKKSFRLPENS